MGLEHGCSLHGSARPRRPARPAEEAEDPVVLRFDPSLDPIMRLALYGGDDLAQMRQIAEKRLKQEFETVKGVAAAQVKGGLEEEIQIDIDQGKLARSAFRCSRSSISSGARTSTSRAVRCATATASTWCGRSTSTRRWRTSAD